jgi:hypothetical protein
MYRLYCPKCLNSMKLTEVRFISGITAYTDGGGPDNYDDDDGDLEDVTYPDVYCPKCHFAISADSATKNVSSSQLKELVWLGMGIYPFVIQGTTFERHDTIRLTFDPNSLLGQPQEGKFYNRDKSREKFMRQLSAALSASWQFAQVTVTAGAVDELDIGEINYTLKAPRINSQRVIDLINEIAAKPTWLVFEEQE